jgi:hypothetical protein
MFDLIKKYFSNERPYFDSLKAYAKKNKYFYRVAQWDWLTKTQIHIYDPHGPRLITLDIWPQLVFLDAKGQLTVAEYVNYMASQYKSKIPPKLDETIIYQLDSLAKLRVIEYSDIQIALDNKFDLPTSSQKRPSGDTSD